MLLPEEKTVTYFLTLCVQDRQHVLANQQCWQAFGKVSAKIKKWKIWAAILSAQEKWEYMRENPVRAGLVKKWNDWPYAFGFQSL